MGQKVPLDGKVPNLSGKKGKFPIHGKEKIVRIGGKSSSFSTVYGLNTHLQHACGEACVNTSPYRSMEGENACGRKGKREDLDKKVKMEAR